MSISHTFCDLNFDLLVERIKYCLRVARDGKEAKERKEKEEEEEAEAREKGSGREDKRESSVLLARAQHAARASAACCSRREALAPHADGRLARSCFLPAIGSCNVPNKVVPKERAGAFFRPSLISE